MSQKLAVPAESASLTHFNTSQGGLQPVSAPDSIKRLPDNRVAVASANGQIIDWLEGANAAMADRFVAIYTDLILSRRLPALFDWSFIKKTAA